MNLGVPGAVGYFWAIKPKRPFTHNVSLGFIMHATFFVYMGWMDSIISLKFLKPTGAQDGRGGMWGSGFTVI